MLDKAECQITKAIFSKCIVLIKWDSFGTIYVKVLCRQTSSVGSSQYSAVGQQEEMGVEDGNECRTLRKSRVPRVSGWI